MKTHSVHPEMDALISFLDQDNEPSIVLDLDYNILGANKAYLKFYGWQAKDTPLGRKCYDISHRYTKPCDQSGEQCPMNLARQSGSTARVLHVHFTPRGQEHVDVELRPIFNPEGQLVAYVEKLKQVNVASVEPNGKGLVGSSPVFNKALSDLSRVAKTDLPVLLQGESGTGKELFARAVHDGSARSSNPFVVVDCSGLTDTLFESELFGYEKGAFTGATQAKAGLIETAKGGTLFLDEIGDVPLGMQVKLLRLLESGTYRRVGGLDTRNADFRLVAATHKPLKRMVDSGEFRADLYYRINVFPIELPALRKRKEDIPKLVYSLLRRGAGPLGIQYMVDPLAMRALIEYGWPGNVRQLKNVLDRARVLADEAVIRLEHLPDDLVVATSGPLVQSDVQLESEFKAEPLQDFSSLARGMRARKLSVDELKAMEARFPGSRKELARVLGISERTLYRKLNGQGD